jgi:hypothetical protein
LSRFKTIPTSENYRYSISGLTHGYEAGEYSPNAFGKVLGSILTLQICCITSLVRTQRVKKLKNEER